MRSQPFLLSNAVLNDGEQSFTGPHGRVALCRAKRIEGKLLDLKGDYITSARQIGCGLRIVPCAFKAGVHDESRWT
jgi:hypothetical protein